MTLVTKPFGDIITFTRASGGGRFNSSGVYEWVGNDVPRFDYDPVTLQPLGILIEEQRTNLLLRSSGFDNAAWGKVDATVVQDNSTAPDGVFAPYKLIESATNAEHRVHQTRNLGAVHVAGSIFVKAGGRTAVRLLLSDLSVGIAAVVIDLPTLTVTSTNAGSSWSNVKGGIEVFGGGWLRCSISGLASVGATKQFQVSTVSGSVAYQGDGTSGIYIWGAQLEAGAFHTSYIPTVASQVTRTADVITLNTGAV